MIVKVVSLLSNILNQCLEYILCFGKSNDICRKGDIICQKAMEEKLYLDRRKDLSIHIKSSIKPHSACAIPVVKI